jgi:hypothetical protein
VLAADPNSRGLQPARPDLRQPRRDALAEESFRRALQLDPRDADTMQNYGWYLCQQQRYAEADAMFRRRWRAAVPRTRARCCAGRVPGARRPAGRGRGTLTRATSSTRQPVDGVNLSEVLSRRGDYERARFYVRRVNCSPRSQRADAVAGRAHRARLGNARARRTSAPAAQPLPAVARGPPRSNRGDSMSDPTGDATPAHRRRCDAARGAPAQGLHIAALAATIKVQQRKLEALEPTVSTSSPTPRSRGPSRRPSAGAEDRRRAGTGAAAAAGRATAWSRSARASTCRPRPPRGGASRADWASPRCRGSGCRC